MCSIKGASTSTEKCKYTDIQFTISFFTCILFTCKNDDTIYRISVIKVFRSSCTLLLASVFETQLTCQIIVCKTLLCLRVMRRLLWPFDAIGRGACAPRGDVATLIGSFGGCCAAAAPSPLGESENKLRPEPIGLFVNPRFAEALGKTSCGSAPSLSLPLRQALCFPWLLPLST